MGSSASRKEDQSHVWQEVMVAASMRMSPMGFPIGEVSLRELAVVENEEVLGVVKLGRLREIIGTGDDRAAVEDDHLVVGDRVVGVDRGRNPDVEGKRCCRVVS